MNKIFGGIVVQFREFFKSVGPTKKYAILGSVFIGALTLVLVFIMTTGKDYSPLLTNIPSDQVSVIVNKLNEKSVPFQLQDNGKAIYVPKELLHATQMTLMSEIGSAKLGQVGFEIFEKQDFGVSSYTQKINYQRALQGELIRAINTITAVKQSKVILAIPNKKTFLEEGGHPSASVVLELHQGKELTEEQIRGVRYLVANAVEGMNPEHVTVVDERGKILTRTSDGATSGSTELLELKHKVERDLSDRIEQILSKVVGHSKVIAKVDATLSSRTVQSVEESVDPEKTAIRAQTSEEESLDGARTNPSGVPGARSNLPGAEDNAGQVGFKQDVKKELKTTNFDVPKTVRNVKEGAGQLERVSVAVLVDGMTTDGKWQPRAPEELVKYETLVKNSIGFNTARGDSLKIETIQFQAEDFTESEKLLTNLEKREILSAILKWAFVAIALILIFVVLIRPFMQWVTDSYQESVEEMLPRTIEELEEMQQVDQTLPGMNAALPILQENIDPDKAESELLRDRIMGLMQKDEEKATNAFSMWLVRRDN